MRRAFCSSWLWLIVIINLFVISFIDNISSGLKYFLSTFSISFTSIRVPYNIKKEVEVKEKETTTGIVKCIGCGTPTKNGHLFCIECYKKYKDKQLLVKITKCFEINILDESYEGVYKCKDGHIVKSKSEREIDNYLFDHNIPHAYEKVVSIDGDSKHDLHPDFCLPNYLGKGIDVYIEHWGFNSDNRDYYKSKKYKIGKYKELGFNSFLKSVSQNRIITKNEEYEIVKGRVILNEKYSFYLELDDINYHKCEMIGASVYDGNKLYYLDKAALMLNSDILKNVLVTFDNKKNNVFLNKFNVICNSKFDTQIASYLLNYNVKDDVANLSNSFGISIAYYENIINKKNKMEEKDIINAICMKAKFLYDTYEEFNNKLTTEELDKLYYEIEHPLIDVLTNMEIQGVNVEPQVIKELSTDIRKRVGELENIIYNQAGEVFNISSPKQLGEILYDKLGMPKGRGKNATSTAHDILIKHVNFHPIINYILEYRNLNKLLTTYLDTFDSFVLPDGKIHTIYKQTGTRTGRLSSIEPNLQNIPVRSEEGKKIRQAFVASENSLLLSCDYSQIELRILAHISNSESLKNAFINGEDIHTHVASDIFGVNDEEVTPNMRRTAKAVIFGIVYGISGYGLGENLDISASEAKKYIDKYLDLYPEVNEYMKNIIAKTRETGYVRTLLNRKREIEEIKNTNHLIRSMGDRMALNTPIQGTSADILKMAMIEIHKKLMEKNYKSKMILQVHDELIFDVKEDEFDTIKDLVKTTMENIYKLSVPLKVSTDSGKNWYDAK